MGSAIPQSVTFVICSTALVLGPLASSAPADNLYSINEGNNPSIVKIVAGASSPVANFGFLSNPSAIAFDSSGTGYVGLAGSSGDIYKFSTTAGSLGPFATGLTYGPSGLAFDRSGNLYATCNATVREFAPDGASSVFANLPTSGGGLAFDSSGNLYVVNGNAIEKISSTGTDLGAFASAALGAPLDAPIDIAIDGNNNLFVSNINSSTIVRFDPAGHSSLFADSDLSLPYGLAFDSSGNLYAGNLGNGTISRFTSSGDGSLFFSGNLSPITLAFTDDAGRPLLPAGPVPEPASLFLLALCGLGMSRRRRV